MKMARFVLVASHFLVLTVSEAEEGKETQTSTTTSSPIHETTTLGIEKEDREEVDLQELTEFSNTKYFDRTVTFVMPAGQKRTCFSIDLEPPQVVENFEYEMLTTDDNNGKPYSMMFEMIQGNANLFHSMEATGGFQDWKVDKKGTYDLCFSLFSHDRVDKKISFILEVDGLSDHGHDKLIKVVKDQIKSEEMKRNIMEVLDNMKNFTKQAIFHQFRRTMSMTRSIARNMSLAAMIDKWSFMHILVVIGVSVGQAFFLKSLFHAPPDRQGRRVGV